VVLRGKRHLYTGIAKEDFFETETGRDDQKFAERFTEKGIKKTAEEKKKKLGIFVQNAGAVFTDDDIGPHFNFVLNLRSQ